MAELPTVDQQVHLFLGTKKWSPWLEMAYLLAVLRGTTFTLGLFLFPPCHTVSGAISS